MAARVMKSPTASRGEVVVSLIQQRLALRRQRLWGLFSLIIGLQRSAMRTSFAYFLNHQVE